MKQADLVALKRRVMARDGFCCRDCFAHEKLHVHHIIPVSFRQIDTMENLITVCRPCHELRHRKIGYCPNFTNARRNHKFNLPPIDFDVIRRIQEPDQPLLHPNMGWVLATLEEMGVATFAKDYPHPRITDSQRLHLSKLDRPDFGFAFKQNAGDGRIRHESNKQLER